MSLWSVYELQGNLCFHTWITFLSSFFNDLGCFSHIFSLPSHSCCTSFSPFLKDVLVEMLSMSLTGSSFGQWWVCPGASWNWLCPTWEQLLLFSHSRHSHRTLPATKALPCELNIGQYVRRKSHNTGGA